MLILQQVEDLVIVLDETLRASASSIGQKLRRAGRRVDLVLEAKKMKWVFKVCARSVCNLISHWRVSLVCGVLVVLLCCHCLYFTMLAAHKFMTKFCITDDSSADRNCSHHADSGA